MLLIERVIRYLQLCKEATAVENEKKGLQNYFKENLDVILEAREIVIPEGEPKLFTIPVDNIIEYKVCEKKRNGRPSTDYDKLKELYPEAYEECVTKGDNYSYIEVRQRRIQ